MVHFERNSGVHSGACKFNLSTDDDNNINEKALRGDTNTARWL